MQNIPFTEEEIIQLLEESGFRLFKKKEYPMGVQIVAADNGDSGAASKCAVSLIRNVSLRFQQKIEPTIDSE